MGDINVAEWKGPKGTNLETYPLVLWCRGCGKVVARMVGIDLAPAVGPEGQPTGYFSLRLSSKLAVKADGSPVDPRAPLCDGDHAGHASMTLLMGPYAADALEDGALG